jgi:hypothetical protein
MPSRSCGSATVPVMLTALDRCRVAAQRRPSELQETVRSPGADAPVSSILVHSDSPASKRFDVLDGLRAALASIAVALVARLLPRRSQKSPHRQTAGRLAEPGFRLSSRARRPW